ncbi:PAS domain-containing protein [Lacibacterium aquatile]|uniref:PAS domain-containing protein n=1 Tax=Lacibacterium aquatile TaxID=1168082 RepID=A0ABW5E086_9PROT
MLLRHWRQRAEAVGRLMPSRKDMHPEELPVDLPSVLLVDVLTGSPRYRYRLVGTREVEARGFNPTGHAVETHFYGAPLATVLRLYDTVVARRAPLHMEYPIPVRRFAAALEHANLYLPLSRDGEAVDMIMVYSDYSSVIDYR